MLPRTNILATGRGITRGSNAYTIPCTADSVHTNDRECDLSYIARSLYDRYAAGKATRIPSCSKPNITFDLFYLQKNIIFMYCSFRYMLPKCIKKDFVVLNFNLLLIPKALPIFFLYFGFCKNIVRNKTYQCSKCKLEHYFSRFLTVSYM